MHAHRLLRFQKLHRRCRRLCWEHPSINTDAEEMTVSRARPCTLGDAPSQMTGEATLHRAPLVTDRLRAGEQVYAKQRLVTFNRPKTAYKHTRTCTAATIAFYFILHTTPCTSDCYPVCWEPALPEGEPE